MCKLLISESLLLFVPVCFTVKSFKPVFESIGILLSLSIETHTVCPYPSLMVFGRMHSACLLKMKTTAPSLLSAIFLLQPTLKFQGFASDFYLLQIPQPKIYHAEGF